LGRVLERFQFLVATASNCNAPVARNLALELISIPSNPALADIPVEQPTKFDLIINLKAAKAIGHAVNESLLLRVDEGSNSRLLLRELV